MRVIIYESSAHGGNFKYALELFSAYHHNSRVKEVTLLIPKNAPLVNNSFPVLLSYRINAPLIFQRLFFLWRNLLNPFILFFYLIRQRKSWVILNVFEQLTAPVWAPW